MKFKEQAHGYGVRIKREDGTRFLASGNRSAVAYFYRYQEAKQFRDELAEEFKSNRSKSKLRAVRVKATHTFHESTRGGKQ